MGETGEGWAWARGQLDLLVWQLLEVKGVTTRELRDVLHTTAGVIRGALVRLQRARLVKRRGRSWVQSAVAIARARQWHEAARAPLGPPSAAHRRPEPVLERAWVVGHQVSGTMDGLGRALLPIVQAFGRRLRKAVNRYEVHRGVRLGALLPACGSWRPEFLLRLGEAVGTLEHACHGMAVTASRRRGLAAQVVVETERARALGLLDGELHEVPRAVCPHGASWSALVRQLKAEGLVVRGTTAKAVRARVLAHVAEITGREPVKGRTDRKVVVLG